MEKRVISIQGPSVVILPAVAILSAVFGGCAQETEEAKLWNTVEVQKPLSLAPWECPSGVRGHGSGTNTTFTLLVQDRKCGFVVTSNPGIVIARYSIDPDGQSPWIVITGDAARELMQAEPERMRCFARWLMAAIEKDADAGSAHSTSRPVSAEREPWGTLSGELGGWPFADVIVPHEKPEVKLDGRLIEWRWFLEHLRTGEMDQKIIVIRDPSARQW